MHILFVAVEKKIGTTTTTPVPFSSNAFFSFTHAKIDLIRCDLSFKFFATYLVPGFVIHHHPYSPKT